MISIVETSRETVFEWLQASDFYHTNGDKLIKCEYK